MKYKGFDLTGRSCIVTGAGTGIGKAIAVGLAQAGAEVAINGRRPEPLEQTKAEVEAQGVRCLVVAGDISDLGFHGPAVKRVIKAFGKIDVLVNNAAVLYKGPIEETTPEIWDSTIDINLKGNFFFTLAVGKEMIKAKQGRIINILSNCSFVAEHGIGAYCISKGGLLMTTRCLATEWGPYGIQVNAIGPAFVRTPMNNPVLADPSFVEWSTNRIPLHRMGQPEEMVGAAIYLASDAASFTNGTVIMCDGGFTAC
ncbi:MAG: glucose 1-dehydrogenase [Desulfarculus sp.]|jgi:gluconate 5-dehydrogenase|nr:MAG: glucose 1-dehydrogenase [Desulfarculus sp.]